MTNKCSCLICRKIFSKYGIKNHISITHDKSREGYWKNKEGWSKGLSKDTDIRVANQGKSYSDNIKSGKTIATWKGKAIPKEIKEKISKGMKLAHKEGRAWNIGMSRWNNEPSYPESFFMKVIENEFIDKNYITEFNVGIYSIDFAWIDKKLAIEIDGDQHQRFKEVIERDKRKDKFLTSKGWKILRISWKDMFNDTKHWISKAKEFIDDHIPE